MSSRTFRRLQQDETIKVPSRGNKGEEEDEDEDNVDDRLLSRKSQQTTFNPFDMLIENDDSPIENDEQDTENTEKVEASPTLSKQLPKKKKKKKKKDKQPSLTIAPVDEVEVALKEVNEMLGGLETAGGSDKEKEIGGSSRTLPLKPLLCVDRRHLNADNEMRRIFGSKVIRAEQNSSRSHRKRLQKQSILATPKDTWPQMGKLGLTMSFSEVKNNCQYFKFVHSVDYQKVQFKFWQSVETYDPSSIAVILHAHPYHIDSLLQLSEVCKMGEDIQMAADLIERAVYHFESVFHPLYNYTQDNCRLDYSRSENRSFFLVLFKHLNYVDRRGCHRTAFEFCKLLLSLDPVNDPLCVLLLIDYFAIRANEYQFLIDLNQRWETTKNLSQLPNCSMSLSLAYFHLSRSTDKEDLAALADTKLQDSLIMFPSLLVPLLDKCSVHLDPYSRNHSYFTSTKKDPQALELLVKLYIERSHSLWKEPEVLTWLECNVKKVIERVQSNDPLIQQCQEKRQRCYVGTPRNIYRHVLLSDLESVTTSLPQDITRTPIMSYDPLPPENSTTDYERPLTRSHSSLDDDDSNPFTLFLRSLLPSFNMQEPPHLQRPAGIPVPQQEPGAVGGANRGFALEQAIGQLTESMRVLLDQIRTVIETNNDNNSNSDNNNSDDD